MSADNHDTRVDPAHESDVRTWRPEQDSEPIPRWLAGYSKMPMWAVLDERLTDGERVTLQYVVGRIFGTDYAISVGEVAGHRRICLRSAIAHLRRLCELDYLAAEHRRGKTTRYAKGAALEASPDSISVPPPVQRIAPVQPVARVQDAAGDPCNELQGGVQPVARGECSQLHPSSDKQPTEQTKEKTTRASAAISRPRGRSRKSKPDRLRTAMADERVLRLLEGYRELHSLKSTWKPETKEARKARAVHVLDALEGNGTDQLAEDEIRLAFIGNRRDEWHAERGKHEIEYVLRPGKAAGFIKIGRDWEAGKRPDHRHRGMIPAPPPSTFRDTTDEELDALFGPEGADG